jgi:putative Mg2+ transporter-C (MgtC) family protein
MCGSPAKPDLKVSTAATLWAMTAIGVCLAGGQLGLGIGAALLSVFTLWFLKWVDNRIPREHRAMLVIVADVGEFAASDVSRLIAPLKYQAPLSPAERHSQPSNARILL